MLGWGRKAAEHLAHFFVLPRVKRGELFAAFARQSEQMLASIGFRPRPLDQSRSSEVSKHATDITGVQSKLLDEVDRSLAATGSKLIHDAHLREGKTALEQTSTQHADLFCVEPIETADAVDPPPDPGTVRQFGVTSHGAR